MIHFQIKLQTEIQISPPQVVTESRFTEIFVNTFKQKNNWHDWRANVGSENEKSSKST